MTAQELVDFIEANDLGDYELEAKYHGDVFRIVDATRREDMIRLYPHESDE